jgi:hypothetical protein
MSLTFWLLAFGFACFVIAVLQACGVIAMKRSPWVPLGLAFWILPSLIAAAAAH